MNRIRTASLLILFVAVAGLLPASSAVAQVQLSDVITVGSATGAAGTTVDVPVYIRDTAGTPLGIDQPAGSRIQSYSIRVTYSPASSVQSVTFTRAGITAPLTPTFESSPAAPGMISLLDNFDEATNLIPFTSNAALPGNQVAHLLVTIAPGAAPGSTITLTLDPVLTQLTDEGGTPATVETTTNGRLTLVSGAITVATGVPMLPVWALVMLAVSLAVVAVRMRIS
jgi:hypothetical protein